MKKNGILLGFSFLIVVSILLASCVTSTSTSTQMSAPNTTATAKTGNWWNSLGKPQYGGEITLAVKTNPSFFDPYSVLGGETIMTAWLERLFGDDHTLDPSVYGYNIDFRPPDYVKGLLAESWEFPDPHTLTVHLRKGIHWQNISPVNGREFTSADVVYSYDRLFGCGSSVPPSPYYAKVPTYQDIMSLTAPDKYTDVFKFKTFTPEYILETMESIAPWMAIVAPEAVEKWGDLSDWHHAIGTGPFILKDFVTADSMTLVKNPNYWGYDERYPNNQLPYISQLNVLVISDQATQLAGIRTGKIDFMDGVKLSDAQSMQKTNPKILEKAIPGPSAVTLDPRDDLTPFKDIRVREALQMSIDLPTLASTYYSGTVPPYPSSLTSSFMTGWAWPYDQWPQDLKDSYAYNPTAAKQLLAAAGYPNGFNTDCVVDNSGDMDLMQIVKSDFSAIGVNMEIRPMDSASWTNFVVTGHKQDALVQRIGNGSLGLTYEPSRQVDRNATGGPNNYLMFSDPVVDAFGPKALAATTIPAFKQVLLEENQYIAQQHIAICLLDPSLFALYQPWLKGYSGQDRSLSTTTQPFMIGEYASRFWIDQNLKKSMGD